MFHILDVVSGWFIFTLGSDEDAFTIGCSKIADIDVGKQFLVMANKLIRERSMKCYMCLNSEQHVHRMELLKYNDCANIQVCEIDGPRGTAAFRYINASPSELESSAVKPPVFIAEYSAFELAKRIYLEYLRLDRGAYQQNWFSFPQAEYEALNQYMRYRI